MAKNQKTDEVKYKGYQLMKLPQFDNRVGRIVIDPMGFYTIPEVEKLMKDFMEG